MLSVDQASSEGLKEVICRDQVSSSRIELTFSIRMCRLLCPNFDSLAAYVHELKRAAVERCLKKQS